MATNFMAEYKKTPLQILQEKQLETDKAIKAQKAIEDAKLAAEAASSKQLKSIVKRLFEDQFLLNEFKTALVKAYLADQDNIISALLSLYDKALRNNIVGLRRVDTGFEYCGSVYKTVKELQRALEMQIFGNVIENGLNLRAFASIVSQVLSGSESDLSKARLELERQEPQHDLLNVSDSLLLMTYQGDF